MGNYILNKRKFLIAGLSAVVLFATAGCQTLKVNPVYENNYDTQGVYIDDNAREHTARIESLEDRKTPVYLKIIDKTF
jgi:capsular polysaccharide biosynthesis protein